jgi:ribose transport system substrate-binding protein
MRVGMRLGFLLATAAGLAGCGGKGDAASSVRRIAMIPKGTNHVFWKAVEKGAKEADQELAAIEVIWKGPPGEGDAAAQIGVVEGFLAENIAAIALAPVDAKALEKPVRAAAGAKVPVLIFDSGLASEDAPIVSYVATNNRTGGAKAGAALAEALGGRGKVLVLRYRQGSESTTAREEGFLEEIRKHPGITIVSSDRFAGADERAAVDVSENLLSNFGAELNGVFCSNESTASGMLTALRRDPRGLAGKVKLVGFDSSDNLIQGLRDGVIHALVVQDPVKMGRESIRALARALNGESVPKRIDTGEAVITRESMDRPEHAALLNPLADR